MTVLTLQVKRRISIGGAPSSLAVGELALDAVNNALYAGCNSGVVQIGGLSNPMTTLGDTLYGGASGVVTRLAGDTSNTRKFLREQSSGGVATAPVWDTLAAGDLPSAGFLPPGLICPYGGTVAPAGWVLCDGTSYSTGGIYANLYAAIGVVYGNVDGSHFTVPNLKGRFPVGAGQSNAANHTTTFAQTAAGSQPTTGVGGEENHQVLAVESGAPSHTHSLTFDPMCTSDAGLGSQNVTYTGANHFYYQSLTTSANSNAGAAATQNLSLIPPVCVVSYIIKL